MLAIRGLPPPNFIDCELSPAAPASDRPVLTSLTSVQVEPFHVSTFVFVPGAPHVAIAAVTGPV